MKKGKFFSDITKLSLSGFLGAILSFGFPSSTNDCFLNIFYVILGLSGMIYLFQRFCSDIESIDWHCARRAFLLWYVFALCHFATSLYWISNAFDIDKKLFYWLIHLTNIAMPMTIACFYGIFGVAILFLVKLLKCDVKYRKYAALRCMSFSILFALLWVITELLRSYSILPFPWQLLGYTSSFSLEIMQLSYFTTIWGLSFFMAFFCAALASNNIKCRLFALFLTLSIFCFGDFRLSADDNIDDNSFVSLRLVQPNNNIESFKSVGNRIAAFENIVSQSKRGAVYKIKDQRFIVDNSNNGAVDYYVWPESALLFPISEEVTNAATNLPQNLLIENHDKQDRSALNFGIRGLDYFEKILPDNVGLIAGTDIRNGKDIFNGIVFWDRKNNFTQIYNKQILVPFGEYIPLRSLLGLLPVVVTFGEQDFKSGSSFQNNFKIIVSKENNSDNDANNANIDTRKNFIRNNNTDNYLNHDNDSAVNIPDTKSWRIESPKRFITASPSICYEAIFSWPFAAKNNNDADFLLNVTNDMWFGESSGPYQHLAMARMRAIENNKPMIRVANFGISAVFDNKGRIIASIPLNQAGVIDVKIPKFNVK